jgi:hypothetical protein
VDPSSASLLAEPKGKSGTLFGLAIALLLPAGLAGQLANPLGGLLWTEIFVFLLPAVVATAGSNLEPRAWLGLRAPSARAASLGLLAGGGGWLLGSALFLAARALAPQALVERYDLSRLFAGPLAERVGFVAAAVLVAPICEEVAFRGYLAAAFRTRHRPVFSLAAGAFLFALLHLDPLRGPALFLLGLLYGWLAWRSGSIWTAVIAHAANNGIAAALALWAGDAGTGEDPTLLWALAGIVAGSLLVALVVLLHRPPAAPSPPVIGLPLANGTDPSTRFRLSLLPPPLVAAAVAGCVGLGAILLAGR